MSILVTLAEVAFVLDAVVFLGDEHATSVTKINTEKIDFISLANAKMIPFRGAR